MKELEIKVNGMVCGGCENRVKNALSTISGVEKVDANFSTGTVNITSKEDVDINQIKEKIVDLGFEVIEE